MNIDEYVDEINRFFDRHDARFIAFVRAVVKDEFLTTEGKLASIENRIAQYDAMFAEFEDSLGPISEEEPEKPFRRVLEVRR